ncbi:stress response protein NST1-like [Orussus abietinus]|uniref:stress response protein NST1-like n=1 Tax=Orussus abietinus TaxID=222816 RepID=UPI000C715C54|nr:stress response protein NST1-like [Orussus abietinus]
MARKMVQEEDGRREREDTVKELCEQKMKSELEGRIKSEQSKKRLLRTELLEEMASQKRVVAEFRKKEAEMDAAFARNNDEQTRIDREKDRREAEARRERGIQYGQELRAAITRARAKLAEEARRERSLKSLQDERETLRRREIAEERARILSKHAPRLRGFLKPGIVKPEN